MVKRNWTRKVERTSDGSSTFFIPEWNERYHSQHGAVQESMHVFLEMGLKEFQSHAELNVFEMGFGTGLNALLTYLNKNSEQNIFYHSLEAYPLQEEEIKALANTYGEDGEVLKDFLVQEFEKEKKYSNFTLLKTKAFLQDFDLKKESVDLVYYDAFGPRVQPELWELDCFLKMYSGLKPKGCLVTYCAKGQVRRNMVEAGFQVEKLPGPPGKREMLRAWKP